MPFEFSRLLSGCWLPSHNTLCGIKIRPEGCNTSCVAQYRTYNAFSWMRECWAPSRHSSRNLWSSNVFHYYSGSIGCILHSILSYGPILDEDDGRGLEEAKVEKGDGETEKPRKRLRLVFTKFLGRNISRDIKRLRIHGSLTGSLERSGLSPKIFLLSCKFSANSRQEPPKTDFGFIHNFESYPKLRRNRGTYSGAPMSN